MMTFSKQKILLLLILVACPSFASASATVTGQITNNSGGVPIAGALVEVLKGNVIKGSGISDASGTYFITNTNPGTVTLRVSAAGYRTRAVGAKLTNNQTTTENIALTATTGTISGTVTDVTTVPISGALVNIYQGTTLYASVTTNASGFYTVPGLAPGVYIVVANANGYESDAQGASVTVGNTTIVDFALFSSPGTVAGTITDAVTTAPLRDVTVFITDGNVILGYDNTNISGNYSIPNLAPGFYVAVAFTDDYDVAVVGVNVTSGVTTILNFALIPNPGILAGIIIDAVTRRPIQGATIEVFQGTVLVATVLTDQRGSYEVLGLGPGQYAVVASADSFQTQQKGASITSNETTVLNFALEPNPSTITGTVIDANTTDPIIGAAILVFQNNILVSFERTDSQGNYTIDDLTPGNYLVVASKRGYRTAIAGAFVAAGASVVANFALNPIPGALAGTVTDATTTNPIVGAMIGVYQNNQIIASAVTDSSGNYTISGLAPGNYNVIAQAASYQTQIIGASVVSGMTTSLSFALNPNPGTISGIVRDAITLAPLAGAFVVVGQNGHLVAFTITDDGGNYTLANLAPENYTVVADKINYHAAAVGANVVSNETSVANFNLIPRPGAIAGILTDANTTNPLASATIRVFRNGVEIANAITNNNGTYFISGLAPGSYTLIASAADYQSQVIGAIVESSSIAIVSFALDPNPGSISGIVTDSVTLNPIPSASVTVRQNGVLIATALTDSNGQYSITSLPPGVYQLICEAINYRIAFAGASVASNTTTIVNFSLTSNPGTITGVVRNALNGNRLPGSQINIYQGIVLITTALTDSQGEYQVPDLAPGIYTVSASATNFQSQQKPASVVANDTAITNFDLIPNPGSVSGVVTSQTTTNPIAGANVDVLNGPLVVASTLTDPAGNYSITGLAPGLYTIRARANNFQGSLKPLTITAGKNSVQNFQLNPFPGTLSGVVVDSVTLLPIVGAVVGAFEGSTLVGYSFTDEFGNYTITGLAPGTYNVVAGAVDHSFSLGQATIIPNTTTFLNFQLDVIFGSITGTIVSECGNQPVSQVLVLVFSGTDFVTYGLTDDNGLYTIDELAPGSYTLIVARRGFVVASASAEVIASTATIVDFVITPIPLPPQTIEGFVVFNQFLTNAERVHKIVWTASPSGCVQSYQIFIDGTLAGVVPANAPLVYYNRCRNRRLTNIYQVRSVNEFGQVSDFATITLS